MVKLEHDERPEFPDAFLERAKGHWLHKPMPAVFSTGTQVRTDVAASLAPRPEQSSQVVDAKNEPKEKLLERYKKLRFDEIFVDPEDSPEVALKDVEKLYNKNLAPNEAFEALAEGDFDTFNELIKRGIMLNNWDANEKERPYYPENYESVKEQMYRDLTGRSGRPGNYRVFGLRDPSTGDLRGWISARFPPVREVERARYAEFLHSTFFNKERGMHIESPWEEVIAKQFPNVLEIDTLITDVGHEALGHVLVGNLMKAVKREIPEEFQPTMAYNYRFSGLKVLKPEIAGMEAGANDSSGRFIHSYAFADIGYRRDPEERVVREVPDMEEPVVLGPRWQFSSAAMSHFEKSLQTKIARHEFLRELIPE